MSLMNYSRKARDLQREAPEALRLGLGRDGNVPSRLEHCQVLPMSEGIEVGRSIKVRRLLYLEAICCRNVCVAGSLGIVPVILIPIDTGQQSCFSQFC